MAYNDRRATSVHLFAYLLLAGRDARRLPRCRWRPARLGDVPRRRAGQGLLVRHPPRAERGRHGRPVRHARPEPGTRPAASAPTDKAGPRRGDIVILVHAGRYELAEPLVFAPEDSGTAESPTVFAAAPGDEGRVVLSGGRAVSGWKAEPGPRGEWVADLPGLKDGWRFRHVSVDGQWRGRPRLPDGETATYTMAGLAGADPKAPYDTPADRFEYAPGQIDPRWTTLRDVEVVVLHFWIDSHLKIAAVEPDRRVVKLDRTSQLQVHRRASAGPRPLLPRERVRGPRARPVLRERRGRHAALHAARGRVAGSRGSRRAATREPGRVPGRPGLGPVRRAPHPAGPDLLRYGLGARPARRDGRPGVEPGPGRGRRHRGAARRDRGVRAEEPRRLRRSTSATAAAGCASWATSWPGSPPGGSRSTGPSTPSRSAPARRSSPTTGSTTSAASSTAAWAC